MAKFLITVEGKVTIFLYDPGIEGTFVSRKFFDKCSSQGVRREDKKSSRAQLVFSTKLFEPKYRVLKLSISKKKGFDPAG